MVPILDIDHNVHLSKHYSQGLPVHGARLGGRFPLCKSILPTAIRSTADIQGFDNGWWGTVLGAQKFLCDYGSERTVDGVNTCFLPTASTSAGTGVGSAGIVVGCACAIYLNEYLGRKRAILATAVISVIGVVIEMTSAIGTPRFAQFCVGKLIASISMGLAANIVPIYLSETSVPEARGFVVNMYSGIQVAGLLIASGSVYGVASRMDPSSYLIPMGLQLLAPTVMIASFPFVPESPRWLIWKE